MGNKKLFDDSKVLGTGDKNGNLKQLSLKTEINIWMN